MFKITVFSRHTGEQHKLTAVARIRFFMVVLGLCGGFVWVRQRRRRDTAQWKAFQRRCWVAGEGQLACSKHVNTGIVWIGRDYCGFDWPHKSWWCFVIILLRVSSSFYSSRTEKALDISHALSHNISYMCCLPFEFLLRAILLFY